MFVIRFEDKKTGNLFYNRYKIKNKKIQTIIKNLADLHDGPDEDHQKGMRHFHDIEHIENKFAFTPHAFENKELAKNLVKLSKFKRIKMMIIPDPEILWISKSGLQVAIKA
jgi:hypothetical protein